jgi:ferredoxin--NADP+ reductase
VTDARVVVVGAGPAGLYAAAALAAAGVHVDVAERLPAPYGLVRYGVAPDHPKIKSVTRALGRPFESPYVRFFGNVTVGTDLTLEDLTRHYDAVLYSTGAGCGRRAGIVGDDLPASLPAGDFVSWYSGHPAAPDLSTLLNARGVVVIGAGNVALDVVRMLVKSPELLAETDVPDPVLAALRASRVTDVHLLARRGPAAAKFSPLELRELGELSDVELLLPGADLDAAGDIDRAAQSNLETLREWSKRAAEGAGRRVWLRFDSRTARVLGGERGVSGVLLDSGEQIDAQAVLHAVGYHALALPGVPFDEVRGTVPNLAGRVVDTGGKVLAGVYVAGWLKRGATGVIGTNKADAAETVSNLLSDLSQLPRAAQRHPDAIPDLLDRRRIQYVTWAGWKRIQEREAVLGSRQGRPAVKLTDVSAMLAVGR